MITFTAVHPEYAGRAHKHNTNTPITMHTARAQRKNPFSPIALTMVQLRNVVCFVHAGQHSQYSRKRQALCTR